MLVAPVQQFLDEAVRTGPHPTRSCLNAPVEIQVAADKMNGGLLPGVADCVRLAADFLCLGCLKAPVVEQLEHGQEPALTGETRAGISSRQFLAGGLKVGPRGLQAVPCSIGRFADLLSRSQMIGR